MKIICMVPHNDPKKCIIWAFGFSVGGFYTWDWVRVYKCQLRTRAPNNWKIILFVPITRDNSRHS